MGKPEFIGAGRAQELKEKQVSSKTPKDKELAGSAALAKEISAGSVEHIENVEDTNAEVKPSRKKRLTKHCGRFWCCYCIGIIVLLAIMLPIL